MVDLVFFYGTLMTPFHRTGQLRVDQHLDYLGRGTIAAALFDLGIYPAAVPASAAVMDTPGAPTSGFVRPSSVGPRLEKYAR